MVRQWTYEDYYRGRHVIYKLHIHLVFVTKYRKGCLTNEILDYIEKSMKNVCTKYESTLTEFNGERDHVHLLIDYPPKVSISKLVNSLKTVSSFLVRRDFKDYISKYIWGKNALWSPSYFVVSCGGAPLEKVKKYIQNQTRPSTFKKEYRDHECESGKGFNVVNCK